MTIDKIKEDIHKAIDNVPDHELPQLENHIKSILAKYPTKEDAYKIIDRIMKEEHELLKRLADS